MAASVIAASGSAVSASTTLIDFDAGFSGGQNITGLDLGGVSLSAGGNPVTIAGGSPNGSQAILAFPLDQLYRADFSVSGVSAVSVDIGDFNQDADDLLLEAYDMFDMLLDSFYVSIPSSFSGFETLSVSATNISYVIFGGSGLSGNNNVYADNLSFTTVASVPLPAGGLLLLSALGGFAALRRRNKA